MELMETNYEAELAERVQTDLNDYVEQFPVYKVSKLLIFRTVRVYYSPSVPDGGIYRCYPDIEL